MKYIVYKTINLINKKYYIGVHQTENINDDYLGCGHWLGRKIYPQVKSPILKAFIKYGDYNFNKEILFIFENRKEAYKKEQELVNVNDPFCYNARLGGDSGYLYSKSAKEKMSESARERSKKLLLQTNILKEFNKWKKEKTYKEIYGEEKAKEVLFKKSLAATGKKHSKEAKRKMSLNRKGKDCGKCKGRKKVYDSVSNKIIRLFPQDIQNMIAEGIVINQFKKVSKFHNVNYIKIK